MKRKEIRIPNKLKNFTLAQMRDTFEVLKNFKESDGELSVVEKTELVSIWSGVPFEELKDAYISDINKICSDGLNAFNTYTRQLPPDEITLNGKTYERIRFEDGRTKGGWFIDVKTMKSQFKESPEIFAALNYIEKGLDYSQKDAKGYTINPTRDRAEAMKAHFEPDVFLNLQAFFLSRSEELNKDFSTFKILETIAALKIAQKTTRKKTKAELYLIGCKLLIQSLTNRMKLGTRY